MGKKGNIAFFIPHAGCPAACSFCNQRVISGEDAPPTPQEIENTLKETVPDLKMRGRTAEIAFFGGSFTALPLTYQRELLSAASPFVDGETVTGIRVSTRPDAISEDVLSLLHEHHGTAIELGAQSMKEEVLLANKRGHTAEDVRTASRMIKEAGFTLGLQMMTGLYLSSPEDDYRTGEALLALSPKEVRIYPTVVLCRTELHRLMDAGLYCPPDAEATLPLAARLADLFEEHGVTVLRMGLHASRSVEKQYVGGCYHPAFAELVENERYLSRISAILERDFPLSDSEGKNRNIVISVPKGAMSKAAGHRRRNLLLLTERGYRPVFREDAALSPLTVRISAV